MTDRLVILGAKGGPAVRRPDALPTAMLLELAGRQAIIDCGLGVTRAAVAAGIDLRRLRTVFVTHLHSDHVLELGPLLHTAWTTGAAGPIDVWGPVGLADYWAGFCAAMAFDNDIRVADEGRRPLQALVRLHALEEGALVPPPDDGAGPGWQVTALRVPHPPVTDCFALRISAGGKSVALSADTAHFPPLADFARGADLLVHEAMLPAGMERIVTASNLGDALRRHLVASHSTAAEAAAIARAAGVGHLVLNHLIPADDPGFSEADWRAAVAGIWNGPLTIARDGTEIAL